MSLWNRFLHMVSGGKSANDVEAEQWRVLDAAKGGSTPEKEAAVAEFLAIQQRNRDTLFPAGSGISPTTDLHFPGSRQEYLSAENNPDLYHQTQEMTRQLNERYGTQYPMPRVLIVDQDNAYPQFNVGADTVVIPRRTLEAGHAPAMIAHELAERQGTILGTVLKL